MTDNARPICYCVTEKHNFSWKFMSRDEQEEFCNGVGMSGPFDKGEDAAGYIKYWTCTYCGGSTSTARLGEPAKEDE